MKRTGTLAGIILLATAFFWALGWIYHLRFEQGDMYPAYSSFRSDPMGLKGLYEALAELPTIQVRRNLHPWDRMDIPAPATYIVAGLSPDAYRSHTSSAHEALLQRVKRGSRLVLAFHPLSLTVNRPSSPDRADLDPNDPNDTITLAGRLGYTLRGQDRDPNMVTAIKQPDADPSLPVHVPWWGPSFLDLQDPAWKTVYTCDRQPVIAVRTWGAGSIVIMAHPYLLANEALMRHRQTALLTWLLGSHQHIIIDETHLGMEETGSIAALARTYRLHGLAVGLALLAILYVWSRSVPVELEAADIDEAHRIVPGQAAASGLTSLLQRNIAARDLLTICYQEWSKSMLSTARLRGRYQKKADEVHRLIQETSQDGLKEPSLIDLYHRITKIIQHKGNP